jgi:hypothetical protein
MEHYFNTFLPTYEICRFRSVYFFPIYLLRFIVSVKESVMSSAIFKTKNLQDTAD